MSLEYFEVKIFALKVSSNLLNIFGRSFEFIFALSKVAERPRILGASSEVTPRTRSII